MHKIDHPTAQDGQFVEGNPATATPSTVVAAAWANAVQNELINFIVSRGIDLDKADNNQLTKALHDLLQVKDSKIDLQNNQANTLLGAIFEFDIAKIKSVVIEVDIYRKDNTQEKTAVGTISILGLPGTQEYKVVSNLVSPDDGPQVSFDIVMVNGVGKLNYSSSNFLGSNYFGQLTYKITVFKR